MVRVGITSPVGSLCMGSTFLSTLGSPRSVSVPSTGRVIPFCARRRDMPERGEPSLAGMGRVGDSCTPGCLCIGLALRSMLCPSGLVVVPAAEQAISRCWHLWHGKPPSQRSFRIRQGLHAFCARVRGSWLSGWKFRICRRNRSLEAGYC